MDVAARTAATTRRTKRRGRHPDKALSAAFVGSAPPGRHADANLPVRPAHRNAKLGPAHRHPRTLWHVNAATAREVRQRIRSVLEWAVVIDLRNDNPCDRVAPVLGPQNDIVTHRKALSQRDVAAALETVRNGSAQPAARLAFEFLLTAAPSGEDRLATWDEIDTAGAVWTVPAARMKAKREHPVPLCASALQVLDAARTLRDGNGLVFRCGAAGR